MIMRHILFVCTGNTCRSVMADALLRRYWESAGGSGLEIASAGLAASPGSRASEQVRQLLSEEGISVEHHSAVLLEQSQINRADLILVMTAEHSERLTGLFPEAAPKVHLLKQFAHPAGDNHDIADPFAGSLEKYSRCLEEIRCSITKLIEKLKGGEVQ
jgi:protein arginine phosphatase